MTSIAGGFTFGFVGRIGGSGDDGDRGATAVWASYAADAGLLQGFNETAARAAPLRHLSVQLNYSLTRDHL